MNHVLFSARVEVQDLNPNYSDVARKVRAGANSLRTHYAKFPDSDVRVDLKGDSVDWIGEFSGKRTGEYSPTVVADIQVRTAKKDRVLTTSVQRKVGELFNEPLWKFFWRIRRETDKLIESAGLKPSKTA